MAHRAFDLGLCICRMCAISEMLIKVSTAVVAVLWDCVLNIAPCGYGEVPDLLIVLVVTITAAAVAMAGPYDMGQCCFKASLYDADDYDSIQEDDTLEVCRDNFQAYEAYER